ncbi:hypothetical protein FRACYDRAFT_269855 [Fragilariopsis cylindrus CCMP1102]|uniref:Uncharacterized protein n=1 Tax=Fragilariopsis cylindrus CCMP1102 TaxID=635003 RepID=A0A1E7F5S4_9STRA|nr:hypothetical protein FRACYDRAFT_269855 [Fragilariopsis cylindrus CCMP1102]|eukprot:OEU13538.1 hypothetical protein FRACYDRAFT_269855 [Fragilariopsis cylindrus CCMP1102]
MSRTMIRMKKILNRSKSTTPENFTRKAKIKITLPTPKKSPRRLPPKSVRQSLLQLDRFQREVLNRIEMLYNICLFTKWKLAMDREKKREGFSFF